MEARGPAILRVAGGKRPMTDLLMLGRLEEALTRDGCPVCHEVGRATRQYLKQFLREGKAGDLAWESFREARGFCPAHTRLVKERDAGGAVEGLNTATLYGWLLADLRQAAGLGSEDGPPAWPVAGQRRRARGFRDWLKPAAPCPACRDMAAYAAGVIGALQRFLSPSRGMPDVEARFRRSKGLCLPHFREMLVRVEDPAAYRLVFDVQLGAIRTLAAELAELRESYDHRHAETGVRPGTTAWRRVLDLFGGQDD